MAFLIPSSERLQAIQQARTELERQPLYLDSETTGLSETDEIVELCIVDHDGTVLVDSLVKPQQPIPADAIQIHGISNQVVKAAPTWPELWHKISAAFGARRIAIYNANFDLRMMKQTHAQYGMQWNQPDDSFFCLMKLYARFYGEWSSRYRDYRWHSLEAAAAQCGIPLPPRVHRAREDTLLARAVLEYIAAQNG